MTTQCEKSVAEGSGRPRIASRLLARELTEEDLARVSGGSGQYTKTLAHGEMGDYVSP